MFLDSCHMYGNKYVTDIITFDDQIYLKCSSFTEKSVFHNHKAAMIWWLTGLTHGLDKWNVLFETEQGFCFWSSS